MNNRLKQRKVDKLVVFIMIGCILLLGRYKVNASEVIRTNTITMIKGVPIINQLPELPSGCEVTALSMLTKYNKLNIDKIELAKQITKAPLPSVNGTKKYGAHPDTAFVGDPFSQNGYGVYVKPILQLINKYNPGRALDLTGVAFESLLKGIDLGIPIMIWVSRDMKETYYNNDWFTPKGYFKWIAPEHTVVIVGYTDEVIFVNDPQGGEVLAYNRQLVESRWEALGKQAVAIKPQVHTLSVYIDEKIVDLKDQEAFEVNNEIWIPVRLLNTINSKVAIDWNGKEIIIKYKNNKKIFSSQYIKNLRLLQYKNTYYMSLEFLKDYLEIKYLDTKKQLKISTY